MMRSMFSGVSGLRTHQLKMDVIGNNIANVNTVGFKSSRVTFKEVFSQTVSGASAANAASGRGGVNPMQVGLGVGLASVDNIMTQGMAQRTDYTMDLMIDGDAFFIVSDANGKYFTRNGAMYTDESGNLSLSGTNGLLVNGWYAVPEKDGAGNVTGDYVIDKGFVEPIRITGEYEYITPKVTTSISYSGNLNATTNPEVITQINFYDSLGNNYVMDVKLEKVGAVTKEDSGTVAGTEWDVSFGNYIYLNGDRKNPISLKPSYSGTATDSTQDYTPVGTLLLDTNGRIVTKAADGKAPISGNSNISDLPYITNIDMVIDTAAAGTNPIDPNSTFANKIGIDFSKLTQYPEKSNPSARALDGTAPGLLTDISIGPTGEITGRYSNGLTQLIAQIAVASFDNPAGLEKAGNNLFVPTRNSGEFRDGEAFTIDETGGSFIVGSLEMSNVDLSTEFTDMIITQRGFQANSRIITTSDEMLQELVNLKR